MSQLLSVALAQNLPQPLTYHAPKEVVIMPGTRVIVPLGRRWSVGWVMGLAGEYDGRTRPIYAVFDEPFKLSRSFLHFIARVSRVYLQSQGMLLDASLPPELKAAKGLELEIDGHWQGLEADAALPPQDPSLALRHCRAIRSPKMQPLMDILADSKPVHYDGPQHLNGPGRLEELIQLAKQICEQGGSLLTLAGDSQTIERLATILPSVRAYHSKISAKERRELWLAAHRGEPLWLIGGVSAALLPIRTLSALSIVDANNPAHYSRFYRDFGAAHLGRLRAESESLPLICSSYSANLMSAWQASVTVQTPPQTVVVNPARWDRPEALERLGAALLERIEPGQRSLYLVGGSEAAYQAWCAPCKKRQPAPVPQPVCPDCGQPLKLFSRLTAPWLKDLLSRRIESANILIAGASAGEAMHLIATPGKEYKSCGPFQRIFLIGPEGWISLDEIDGALRMWGLLDELKELLTGSGQIDVFSTFHFHYALKLANDPAAFFERELNYRRWFMLPPLRAVYQMEFRHKNLRGLAVLMRQWSKHFADNSSVRIEQVHLFSRQAWRGYYKGGLVFHGDAEQIWTSGLFPAAHTTIRLISA